MIKFRCAHCSKLLGGEDKQAGLVVRCPKCKGKTRVPKPGDPAPVKKVEKLEVVEEEDFEIVDEELEVVDEIDLAAFEQQEREERARPKSRRPSEDDDDDDRPRKKPRRPIDDDEDDEDARPRRRSRAPIDEEEDEDEEDDRPRRGSDRGKRGRRRRREEPVTFFTRNRLSGGAGIIFGVFSFIAAVVAYLIMDPTYALYYLIVGIVLGVLFLGAGVVYMIIG